MVRADVHHITALFILVLYGVKVCPYLETLTLPQVTAPILGALAFQFLARKPLRARLVDRAADRWKVARSWVIDSGLWLAGGMGVALFNLTVHDFPLESGLKVLVGFATLGYFAATDLALVEERTLAVGLARSGRHLVLDARYFPLSAKLTLFAAVTAAGMTAVLFLVVAKDLQWLVHGGVAVPAHEAHLSILKDVGFVAVVILAHVVNVIGSFSRNLRFFFDNQMRVMAEATAGRLDTSVPVGSHDEFGLVAQQTNTMIRSLKERTDEVRRTRDATIIALASLAETRDNETGAHVLRTQRYVRALALHLRHHPRFVAELTDDNIELLFKSAPLHDIGKVGIPDHILLKPGKLTDAEFVVMKTHTTLGGEALRVAETVLGSDSFLHYAREIALTHQEKWDGSGYPAGLAGERIPVSGRLMALADVYDALISRRHYKPAFSHDKARAILLDGRGSHFDPDVVDAFLAVEPVFQQIAAEYADAAAAEAVGAGHDSGTAGITAPDRSIP